MAKRLKDVKILEPSDWFTDRYRKRKENMAQDRPKDINQTLQKNNGLAIVLSVLWTGAGHLYVGKETIGITLLIIYFLLAVISVSTGGMFLIVLFPFWIWGIFDAYRLANEYNSGLLKATEERQAEQEKAEIEQKVIEKQTIKSSNFVTQLEKISKLHAAKFLSEEEYMSQKKDLILSLLDKKPQEAAIDFFSALIPSIEKGYLTEEEISQIKKFVE